jgi:dihydrofolate reductase
VTLPVVLVAAMARNGVIGVDNGLPWRMRSDLKHFRATTMGKPLVMGRKTYESIGRPLPGRETVVVSRNRQFTAPGIHVVEGIDAALSLADMIGRRMGADAIIIAGGATLYAETIAMADSLLITELDLTAQGDAAFPPIGPAIWRETSRQAYPRGEGDDAAYTVVHYERREPKRGEPGVD